MKDRKKIVQSARDRRDGLTRKSKAKMKVKGYPKGTLPAYTADYKALGFTKKQAEALGHLAYGQKAIRRRLEAVEAVELARMFGMVNVDNTPHLLECAKRDDKKAECTCGSTPTGATKETEG